MDDTSLHLLKALIFEIVWNLCYCELVTVRAITVTLLPLCRSRTQVSVHALSQYVVVVGTTRCRCLVHIPQHLTLRLHPPITAFH